MFAWLDAVVLPWVESLYATVGYVGVVVAVLVESIVVPIPSELILPLAGFSVAQGVPEPLTRTSWSYWPTVLAGVVGSTIGALLAYAFGRYAGRPTVERFGRYVFLTPDDIDLADRWFRKWGAAAVFFGRCVPMVRSVISVPAGFSRMNPLQFTILSAAGALPWCMLLVWGGMQVGEYWPAIARAMNGIEYAVLALSVLALALFFGKRLVGKLTREAVRR